MRFYCIGIIVAVVVTCVGTGILGSKISDVIQENKVVDQLHAQGYKLVRANRSELPSLGYNKCVEVNYTFYCR